MKTKNRIQQSKYLLTGFVMTLAAVLGAATYTETINGITWTYTISNGGASVGGGSSSSTAVPTSTSGASSALVIPSTLGECPVVSIDRYAFCNCSGLKSVTIPDSVTSIGDNAFYGCSGLKSVTIPDNVTCIGDNAFYGCNGLTGVTIPNSVANIGSYAFYGCRVLINITIPTGITTIGSGAFYGCASPKRVVIPESVTNIWRGAFMGCSGLTSVTIPNSVTSIGSSAFSGCTNLTHVTIPDSVANIGSYAFYGCRGLTNVTISANVTSIEDDTFNGCSFLKEITIPECVRNIGNDAFNGCSWLKGIILPTSVTNIGFRAFCYCDDLTHITIPNGVTSIKWETFAGCSGLTSVTIPNSVTTIGEGAFRSCNRLTDVSIPNCVTNIEASAFRGCNGLTSIVIPDKVTSIGREAFYACKLLKRVILADSVINFGIGAFSNCVSLQTFTCPQNMSPPNGFFGKNAQDFTKCTYSLTATTDGSVLTVYSAPYGAFEDFEKTGRKVSSVAIQSGVVSIGERAFYGLREMETVSIPDTVTTINAQAFGDCSSLTNVTIPSSVKSIGNGAFYGCSRVAAIAFGNRVISIGDSVFHSCTNLTSVTIPDNVRSIGNDAFYGCSGLTTVTLGRCVTNIGVRAFSNCNNLELFTVDVDNSAYRANAGMLFTRDGNMLVSVPGSMTHVTLSDGVTSIGAYAFCGCTNMTNLIVGNNVTNVGNKAFQNCNSIKAISMPTKLIYACNGIDLSKISILFPDSYDKIESVRLTDEAFELPYETFAGCTSLIYVQIPNTVTNIGDRAFRDCSSIKSIAIPNGVQSIGNVFEGCSNLESVKLPESLTCINNSAFKGCVSLANISIPSSVISIGASAFSGCSGLMNVTIPDSVTNIGASAFYDCGGLTSMVIPRSVIHVGIGAFNNCNMLTNFTVSGENTAYISQNGLLLSHDGKVIVCGVNGNVIIPDTVTDVGDSSFSGCSGLTSIMIPNSVTNIGTWAFANCNGLINIEIPESVIGLGWNGSYGFYTAFYGCNGLRQVTVSQYVCKRKLSDILPTVYAEIENIIIPDGVTGISYEAFSFCSSLESICIPNSVTNIGSWAFRGCEGLKNISVPQYVLSRSLSSIVWYHQNITNVVIQDGVTDINNQAFEGCSELKSIMIPASVRNIGDYAFSRCRKLARLRFEGNAPSLGTYTSLGTYIFRDVTDDCCAYVHHRSSGWGVAIPGTWNGIAIDYLDSIVIFDANGGVGGVTNVLERGTAIVTPALTRIGYTFDAWSPNVDATVPSRDVKYTAQWQINQYMVTFDANGGEGGMSEKQDYDTTIVAPMVTRTGYTFRGWSPNVAATVPASNVTYTAQWMINRYTVAFDVNGGTCGTDATTIDHGATVGDLPVPTRANDTFLGWFTAVEGGEKVDSSLVVTEGITLYAHWLTLEESLDVGEGVAFANSEGNHWRPILDPTAKVGDATARSGEIGDRTNTWLSATVSGAGTMSFWCKVSCEHDDDNTFTWDRLMVYTNGVEVAEWRMDGETDWTRREVSFAGGENTVKWVYFKDRSVSEGEDCAWVDGVTWTLADVAVDVGGGKSVLVPMDWIDAHSNIVMAVGGDKSVAMKSTAANGRKVWECYVLGLDPEKTSDFKITSFPLKSDGTPDLSAITFEPAQNRWNLSGATPKLKGKATLDAEWQDVPPGGDPSFRFFTVEVQMP